MKAKTLMGMIACAGACVSLSAFGNTTTNWFSVAASGGQLTSTNAVVKEGSVYTVAVGDDKITIDNDYSTAFVVTTNTASPLNDNLVTITSTAVLTPSAAEDLPDAGEISGAKVGFAVAYDGNNVTNYYYYTVKDAKWTRSGATVTDPEAEKTFTITLDYRTREMSIVVGDSTEVVRGVTFSDETTSFDSVAAFGSGSISSIAGKYEVAVAAYNGTKYGSIAEALKAAGTENKNDVAVVDDSGAEQSTDTAAANGLQKWECAALGIAEDKQVGLAKSEKQTAGMITLAVQNVTVADGLNVTYGISIDGAAATGEYAADDIQIPMGSVQGQHTYTIVPKITAK